MPSILTDLEETGQQQSPKYVRLSLAAAMTLGFTKGWFFRNAKLGCINLLMTYAGGCKANCAFCGLSSEKKVDSPGRNFIRVPWKTYKTAEVLAAVENAPPHVHRVCISMITHPNCRKDVTKLCSQISDHTDMGISLLISPSILNRQDLEDMKEAGADHIGVAIDAATPELFERLRGRTVSGPHRWQRYWDCYQQCLDVFGKKRVGVHLICGLGETEKEMVITMEKARKMGGSTHLFSFFPEKHSAMEDAAPPPVSQYRRIQLTRWLIDNDLTRLDKMDFDEKGRILRFGIDGPILETIVRSGEPFQTSGCPGKEGKVACNRPYGNEKPGAQIRNYPFPPEKDDLERIVEQLYDYSDESLG